MTPSRAFHTWTVEETNLLIAYAPTMHVGELAALLHRGEEGLQQRARILHIRIKRRPMPPVRPRSRNLPPVGLTLALLGEECAAAKIKGVTPALVLSTDRRKALAWIRARVMWRLRELNYSTPVIGEEFGMDHSSVHHAVRRTDLEIHPGKLTPRGTTPLRSRLITMSRKYVSRTAIARAA